MAPSTSGAPSSRVVETTNNGSGSQSWRQTNGTMRSATATGGTSAASNAQFRSRPAAASQQPSLRNTPSTSSLRAKATSAANKGDAQQQPLQQQQQPTQTSLFSQLSRPNFPAPSVVDAAEPTSALVQARLLQIAKSYLNNLPNNDSTFDVGSGDTRTACFYARLALNCDPSNVPARRLLAATLLHGVQLFPFGQKSHALPLASTSLSTQRSTTRVGAHAVLELLNSGPPEVFADVGCARIYATACVALDRMSEAEEALDFSRAGVGRWGTGLPQEPEKIVLPKSLSAPEDVQTCSLLTERGLLCARSNRNDEAQSIFESARQHDPWNWTTWTALCDVSDFLDDTFSQRFPGSTMEHEAHTFYASCLQRALLSDGQDGEAVRRAIEIIRNKGEEYFIPTSSSNETAADRPAAMRTEEMARTASKRTSAQAITPSSTASSLTRPASRTDVAIAAKRMRTMPSTTSNQRAPVAASRPGTGAASVRSATQQAPSVGVTAPKGKVAPPAVSTSTTTGSVRMTGTLSASRMNEQARPMSAASTSSRGTNNSGDDGMKPSPRRSARTNAMGQVENVQSSVPPTIGATQMKPPRSTVVTNRRTVAARPAQRTGLMTNAAPSTNDAEVTAMRKTASANGTASKAFVSLVQSAAREAVCEAALWTAVDEQIRSLTRTLADAYRAVRNGRGQLAIALLRAQGPLTAQEIDGLRREALLAATSPVVPKEDEADARFTKDTIQVYGGLPEHHRNCAEVQCLIARAQHDQGRYHLAEKHFLHARKLSPSLMAHMDIFSLSLFHLQREVRLSQLASELASIDRTNPITYIAYGNAFALLPEHSHALQSFQRACIAAPQYAYAFTLAGYEACEIGQRDKSIKLFRQAIKIEKRHWNAFAGLGQVYLQEDKLQASSYYYHLALELHRTNSVLWDVYGRVKMAQGKLGEAERAFGCALRLNDRSAMTHIKMAELLLRRVSVERQAIVAAGLRERSHRHLLSAVKIAPDEAHVHLMLAKSYMEMGKGTFATLLHNHRGQAAGGEGSEGPQEVEVADLAAFGVAGSGHVLAQQQQQIRAIGKATLPTKYRAEIARHLSTAVDLNPRLARYVKAMGEGARAALRGAAARLAGGGGGGGDEFGGDGSTVLNASLLPDEMTAMTMTTMDEEGLVESAEYGDHVLEDGQSDQTEFLASEEIAHGDESTHEETGEEVVDAFANDFTSSVDDMLHRDDVDEEEEEDGMQYGEHDEMATSLRHRANRLARQRQNQLLRHGLGVTIPRASSGAGGGDGHDDGGAIDLSGGTTTASSDIAALHEEGEEHEVSMSF